MRAAFKKPGDDLHRPQVFRVVGVLAIVVAMVVGYFSYNALKGLPWQSSYDVSVRVPDAQKLIATSDVRIAGVRVGQVAKVESVPGRGGRSASARVRLRLERDVGPLPVDTRFEVRPASVLGATYLALMPGHSRSTVPEGGTLPEAQANQSAEITDFFQMFKGSAAKHFQDGTRDFAYALAGRGEALNAWFGALAGLMPPLERVSRTLSAASTDLPGYISAADRMFTALAPVRDQMSGLFAHAGDTFDAFARERPSVAAAIEASPPAEAITTLAMQRSRPGLDGLARVMAATRRAAPDLRPGFTTLSRVLVAGVAPLQRTPPYADGLRGALSTLARVARIPSTNGAIQSIGDLSAAGAESLQTVLPAQVHCNVFPAAMQEYASTIGLMGFGDGPSMAVITIDNSGNSTDGQQSAKPAPDAHSNYNPGEDAFGCDANNEVWKPNTQNLAPPRVKGGRAYMTTPPPGVLERARSVGLLAKEHP